MDWTSLMGRNNKPAFQDFSSLVTDVHSHILPGLDDGAKTPGESLEMIRGLAGLGYKKLILTPHVMQGFAENSPIMIKTAFEKLKQEVVKENIEIFLDYGAEYMVDEGLEEIIQSGELLSFGNNYVLLELSPYYPFPRWKDILFDLNVKGYKVILAHVERYLYWFPETAVFEELRASGVWLQVNILSYNGYYNPLYRKHVKWLGSKGLIDILGTDLHRTSALPAYKEALERRALQELLESGCLKNNTL